MRLDFLYQSFWRVQGDHICVYWGINCDVGMTLMPRKESRLPRSLIENLEASV